MSLGTAVDAVGSPALYFEDGALSECCLIRTATGDVERRCSEPVPLGTMPAASFGASPPTESSISVGCSPPVVRRGVMPSCPLLDRQSFLLGVVEARAPITFTAGQPHLSLDLQ